MSCTVRGRIADTVRMGVCKARETATRLRQGFRLRQGYAGQDAGQAATAKTTATTVVREKTNDKTATAAEPRARDP